MSEHHHHHDMELPVVEAGGSKWGKAHHILLGFLILAVIVWIFSGFYQVRADETAIVERLGKYVEVGDGKVEFVDTGLHYHLPWPIDIVYKIPIKETRHLTVDTFLASQDAYAEVKKEYLKQGADRDVLDAVFDPYLITADKNVIHMKIDVTYQITDPQAWISTISHEEGDNIASAGGMREEVFRQIVQHAIIHQIAEMPINDVLFDKTEELPQSFQKTIQQAMEVPYVDATGKAEQIDLGITLSAVTVPDKRWPQYAIVDQAFQNLIAARSQKDIFINQAKQQAQSEITQADSQALTMKRDAEAYAQRVSDEAKGEASRFSQVLEQYQNAPDVTRWNVYVEAVGAVSGQANRIMFVQPKQSSVLVIDPPSFDAGQVQPNK